VKTPIWLLPQTVLACHTEGLRQHGGSDGLRDEGLLASALARPQHLFAYEQAGLCRLAAASPFGIIENHPFVDGNKRTAFLAAAVFLERNGMRLVADPAHAAVFVLALADGSLDEPAFASWLRDNVARGPLPGLKRPRARPSRKAQTRKRQ